MAMKRDSEQLVNAFMNPLIYEHPVEQIELIETHISWVFLTGKFAYKIKKPVDFGFLDFSRLEKRRFYCEQELKLNRRLAPKIYLEVLPITSQNNTVQISGSGDVIDYAIKMKQFDQHCLLNKLLKNHQINLSHINALSHKVADFHQQIDQAQKTSEFGTPESILEPVEENFSILNSILTDEKHQKALNDLYQKMQLMYQAIDAQLVNRKEQGYIRECHGDLHLGNIALVDNDILLFDGIEFNDSFRWIDTMSDCAFLIMDLQDHNNDPYAHHFLNQYLFETGDYEGLSVLKFYAFYRAMVRAKVAGLTLSQHKINSEQYKTAWRELNGYLNLAKQYTVLTTPYLAIMHGLSGSGKSWVSSKLSDELGTIILRSDIERKRLFADDTEQLYSDEITIQTYQHLLKTAQQVLQWGFPVIVDATFLDKTWRNAFHKMAQDIGLPFHIITCYTDEATLKQRLRLRQQELDNPSDADVSIMVQQSKTRAPLLPEEKALEIKVDTHNDMNYKEIINRLRHV